MATEQVRATPPIRRLESVPRQAGLAVVLLLVLGGLSLVTALMVDASRAWRAYTFNWLFWASIAQGAVMFAIVVTIARGVWSRTIRRIALSFVAFLPVAMVLFLPILFVGAHIFPWHGEDLHGKEVWLNLPFIGVRNLVLLLVLFGLSLRYAYWSLRPDLGKLLPEAPANRRALYDRLTSGWRGQQEEERIATHKMARLGPALGLIYALTFSMLAWDYVMSLEYHWFSTLIGPYFFMGAFLGGIAVTALVVLIYRSRLGLEPYISPSQLHDLGKLNFGFCIFWAYMFWSQFIVIWYGMLPVEQSFVVHRFTPPFLGPALLVLACLFIIPFAVLLGAKAKKTPAVYGTVTVIILIGLWVERWVLTYPSHYLGVENMPLGWIEVGIALLFAGLFVGSILFFATRFPIFQLWLPAHERQLLDPSLEPVDAVVTAD